MLSGFIKRLLMARQAQFVEGDIKLFTLPFFLMPVEHHINMFTKLQDAYGEKGTTIIFESGKDTSAQLVKYFGEKFSMGPSTELVNLWKNVFESSGLGEMEVVALKPKEGKAIMRLKNSPFARQYLESKGRSKAPVDYHIAGLFSGLMESMAGKKKVMCKETKCIAAGAPFCEFVCSP
jgi:predicted hydrocarbon binding protein